MLVFFGCGYCLCLREGPLPFCCCARRRRVDDDDDDSQSSRVLCCVLQSGGRFVIRGRQESDEEYRRAVLRRERLERERQLGTPEQRRRKVLQSFARCKVIKVSSTSLTSAIEMPFSLMSILDPQYLFLIAISHCDDSSSILSLNNRSSRLKTSLLATMTFRLPRMRRRQERRQVIVFRKESMPLVESPRKACQAP
jgi:hypothetical protein